MFTGTLEEATTRLERMTASSAEPLLTSAEIQDILVEAQRADRYGVRPSDAEWSNTYDLNWAAAEGWELKASKAASTNQFISDARGTASDYTFLNCKRQAEEYRSRITASIPVGTRRGSEYETGVQP